MALTRGGLLGPTGTLAGKPRPEPRQHVVGRLLQHLRRRGRPRGVDHLVGLPGEVLQEARRRARQHLAPLHPLGGAGQVEQLAGPGDPDVGQAPLLVEVGRLPLDAGAGKQVLLQADHVGYRDQRYSASFNDYGRVKTSFEWNQTPLFFSQDTQTLYTETAPGVLRISDAIQSGAKDKRVDMLRRVTDLFLHDSDCLNDQQIAVFDDVLGHLIKNIETQARAELSNRLATVDNAPLEISLLTRR